MNARTLPFIRLGLVGVCFGLLPPAHGAEETAPASSGKQVLFMGTDLSIQQGKKFHRVEDVEGSEFVIKVGGEQRFVRTRLRSNNLKLHPELKLSPISVRLDELRGEAGYTPAADPRHKFNARSGAEAGAIAARDVSEARMAEAEKSMMAAEGGPSEFKKRYEDIVIQEKGNLGVYNQQLGSDYGSVPTMANSLALELAEGNHDMIDVSFKVSSPVELDDPYMVVLVEFQMRGARAGESSLLIHAAALDPIGTEPRFVRIREGGMPVGFKYLGHEVHIYNRGKEVATNESSKRVELTRDEARQYLLIEHMSAHKDATVPPAPVPGSLSPEVRRRLSPEQLQRVCYARVSKDGKLIGAFLDESASLPLADDALNAALADAFYRPALAKGKPMEGIARVRLADLAL